MPCRSALCFALLAAAPASAQFVTGVTRPFFPGSPDDNTVDAFLVDNATGQSTFLFNPDTLPSTAPGFTGLAANDPAGLIYGSTRNGPDDDLYVFDYATFTPTLIGEVFINDAGTINSISLSGLAYDSTRDVLYGVRSLGGSTGPEGLYSIDTTTAEAKLVLELDDGTFDFQVDGIDYDPVTDLLYVADDDTSGPGGSGIFSFDPANPGAGLTFVTSYVSPINDVDGLGAGDGKLFLLSDSPEGNGGNHYVYDIATDTFAILAPTPYDPRDISNIGPLNPSGAGAFAPGLIPEPTTATLLALGSLALLRRRR
ncbi:MAG: hypothetical protein AAF561_15365 [Planctomycetota bacterium]